ncbi:hypothetical protein M758_9G150800 [Ceratodon purpureus]|nr:hypothetical protein M758_9G150800 [Ceratodon purpureus]
MSIVASSTYKVELWVRSKTSFTLSVAFTSSDGTTVLAQSHLSVEASGEWSKRSVVVAATSTDPNARLALTSATRGIFWVDQVSTDTYKELATMIAELKPGFLRFPGGCYVEGQRMANAFRWRDSVGPYEERPGHYGDVWNYWTQTMVLATSRTSSWRRIWEQHPFGSLIMPIHVLQASATSNR